MKRLEAKERCRDGLEVSLEVGEGGVGAEYDRHLAFEEACVGVEVVEEWVEGTRGGRKKSQKGALLLRERLEGYVARKHCEVLDPSTVASEG